jgi:D-alanyl-D-alanine dipeptidase
VTEWDPRPDFPLISDERITSIPIAESGGVLVDAAVESPLLIDPRRGESSPWYSYVRSEVLDRLILAATALPEHMLLCLEEGFRPIAVQREIFDAYVDELRSQAPAVEQAMIEREATRYVAPPDGTPPHSTGGAVDVRLCHLDGSPVDMGTASDDTPLYVGERNNTWAKVSPEARTSRCILYGAMSGAGFVNYPAEWWHWSFGDQYWAYECASVAKFGIARLLPGVQGDP